MKYTTIDYRAIILLCFLWLCHGTSLAQSPTKKIDELLSDDFYQSALMGISVYDITAGKQLYTKDAQRLCHPASNMKLLTSATALYALTPEYQFHTVLYYTGDIDGQGILHGDLYIAGGFDPEFKTIDLDQLVATLAQIGIVQIQGTLYADTFMADSIRWGKAWAWDDDLEAFQPYLTPLPLNRGIVTLKVIPASPGKKPIIKIEPETSFIQIDNRAQTVWRNNEPTKKTLHFSRYSAKYQNIIEVTGCIAASSVPYKAMISLQAPNDYVLTLLMEKLSARYAGSRIAYGGMSTVPQNAMAVAQVAHTLADAIQPMNKDSENLNAEMLLYALGQESSGSPASTEKGIQQIMTFISGMGLNPEKYSIVDGSGLSNQNYLSPELMVTLLKYMYASPYFEIFKNSLPIAGIDGTLAYRMQKPPTKGRVFAKTGSLTGVCTLSGYITTQNGHLLAFSMMLQNFVEKTTKVALRLDEVCEILVNM